MSDVREPEVRAAGGLVWRAAGAGAGFGVRVEPASVEVLVVHRPRYDDWTLPKGKCDPGESYRDCARREVEEETGMRCRLGRELSEVRYIDHHGRTKLVRYWAMEPESGGFAPNDEVDQVEWLAASEVADRLTYAHDGPVVDSFLATLVEPDGSD